MLYVYRCQILRVVDGDTVKCLIDLGFEITVEKLVRLWGINSPEKEGLTLKDGLSAAAHLRLLVFGKPLTVRTLKDKTDKYGRMLGIFHETDAPVSVNQKMLDAGRAVAYMATLDAHGQLLVPA